MLRLFVSLFLPILVIVGGASGGRYTPFGVACAEEGGGDE